MTNEQVPQSACMMCLRLGYFGDFLSRNTLLVSGDGRELMQLANALRQLAIGTHRRLLLGNIHVAGMRARRELWAEIAEGSLHALIVPDVGFWSWRRTAPRWNEAADSIESLARAAAPCHQYLDDDGNSMVMVSMGEYSDGWWSLHARE